MTDECTFSIRVTPRSGRSAVVGERAGVVLIRLASAPVDGAANDALIALLAAVLGTPRRTISIAFGVRSRHKRVRIEGMTLAAVWERLGLSDASRPIPS